MKIEIKKLTPEMAEDYVNFFDITPHDDEIPEHKCYCVCWASDDSFRKDFSTALKRRAQAIKYVKSGYLKSYLAYVDGKVVGWCNANEKKASTKCISWRYFMDYVPIDNLKVKSVFCFTISKKFKRQGIATELLKKVCSDALDEGFDIVEAYPYKKGSYQPSDFWWI